MLKIHKSWAVISLLGLVFLGRQAQAATDCALVTEIPRAECEALIAFYNSTDGENWWDNTGWNVTNSPCSWYAIICDGGHVTGLEMESLGVKGSIPAEIGNLSHLKSLNLSSFFEFDYPEGFYFYSPGAWDSCYNAYFSQLPAEQRDFELLISCLNTMPGYFYLLISWQEPMLYDYRNYISGSIPTELGKLIHLESLNLGKNGLSGSIPAELGNLISLKYLDLGVNSLSHSIPVELGNLSQLEFFNLRYNDLSGSIPAELGNLINLKSLDLSGNQLSDIPVEIGNLSHLEFLDLSDNQLSNFPVEMLANFSHLEFLSLENNEICGNLPVSLMNLNEVSSLNLDYNRLTASDPGLIAWLDEKNPNWANNQIPCSGEICTAVTEIPTTECEALVAFGNSTNETDFTWTKGWNATKNPCNWSGVMCHDGHVTGLFLHGNELTGCIPAEMGNLSHLEYIVLPLAPCPDSNCLAIYENENLHIPCVKVKDLFDVERSFEVDMQFQAFSNPMTFQLTGAKETSTQTANSDCSAIYERSNLHIPCVKVKDLFNVERRFEVDMQFQPLSEPMSFKLSGAKDRPR